MEEKIFRLPKVIINMHSHGRGLKQRHKTTIKQVLREAQTGLINILGFMPNTNPAITNLTVLRAYLNLIKSAKKALKIIYPQYVWFGVTDDNLAECKKALKLEAVIGLKIYPKASGGNTVTTGSIGVVFDKTIKSSMELAQELNKPVAVHGDDPIIIAKSKGNPIEAEVEYDRKILKIARQVPGVKIMFCHVSCRQSAELILDAQQERMQVAMELCPHYLFFDSDGTNWNPELDPVFYHCYNNLRGSEHREYLVSLLATNNPLIIIGSDDAQHTQEEKLRNGPGGLPGNQEMVPAIVTLAVQLGLSEKRVAQLLSFNASDFFKIPVPRELVSYKWEKRVNNLLYNNGKVVNPWNGSELFFLIMN